MGRISWNKMKTETIILVLSVASMVNCFSFFKTRAFRDVQPENDHNEYKEYKKNYNSLKTITDSLVQALADRPVSENKIRGTGDSNENEVGLTQEDPLEKVLSWYSKSHANLPNGHPAIYEKRMFMSALPANYEDVFSSF